MGFVASPFMLQDLLSNLPRDASPTGVGAQALRALTMKPDGSVSLGFNVGQPAAQDVIGSAPRAINVTGAPGGAVLNTIPQPKDPNQPGFLSQAADFLGSGRGQNLLGMLAQAIGGDSTGGRLGQVAQSLGQSQLYRDYINKLLAGQQQVNPNVGQPVLGAELSGLSPELLQRGIETQMAREEQAINELYKRALIANLGQQETPEERFQREMALQLAGIRPSEPKAPETILKSTDPSGKRLPERQYWRYSFDPATGDYTKPAGLFIEPTPIGGGGGGVETATQQRMWYKLALDDAYRRLSLDGYGKLLEDEHGNVTGIKWDNPSEAKAAFKKYLTDSVNAIQRQKFLPPSFLGIDLGATPATSQYSELVGPPAQSKAERARAYLKSLGKEGNDAQVNLFLKNNPQF